MAVNYKKIIGLTALTGAFVYEGLRMVKDGLRGLEKDRQKRKEQKIRDAEWEERNAQKEAERAQRQKEWEERQAQREAERERKQKEWEERHSKREEIDVPEGELETTEINGITHYKNKFGNWCPLKSRTNSDIKITVTNKEGGKA